MKLIKHRERICDELVSQGWTVIDDFFEPDLIAQLTAECREQQRSGLLHQAGTGRADGHAVDTKTRGDQIRWLESGMSPAVDHYLACLEELRQYFNRRLYLGLQDSEHHFAFYPPGSFYTKHLDRFRQDDSRVVSSVLYLNADWRAGHGGELRLDLGESHEDIEPVANRFVLFISAQIVHEVLPTHAERMSLTGWFKRAPGHDAASLT